jgi:hypothetical protein
VCTGKATASGDTCWCAKSLKHCYQCTLGNGWCTSRMPSVQELAGALQRRMRRSNTVSWRCFRCYWTSVWPCLQVEYVV